MSLRVTLALEHLIEEPKLRGSEGYKEYNGRKRHHDYPNDYLELWWCVKDALHNARDDDKSRSVLPLSCDNPK